MKSWKRGPGPPALKAGIGLASSRPIQIPVSVAREAEEQPSLLDEVVPVLPATGRPIWCSRPVPVITADCKVRHLRRYIRRDQVLESVILVLATAILPWRWSRAGSVGDNRHALSANGGIGSGHFDEPHSELPSAMLGW